MIGLRDWVLQDWAVNAVRPDSQWLLAWFRLAQWAVHHPNGIVLNPHSTLGSDCRLRQGVTIGNRVDRDGTELGVATLGVATLGDAVDLGAGCMVIGDIHVGDHARVGALAVVLAPVPDWGVVAGNPARLIRVDAPEVVEAQGAAEART